MTPKIHFFIFCSATLTIRAKSGLRPCSYYFPGNRSQFSGQKCQNHCTVVHFVASRNSEPDPPDPPDPADPADPAETQHFRQNRPWVPHAGGQDDGSLHKLPNYNMCNIYIFHTRLSLSWLCFCWLLP